MDGLRAGALRIGHADSYGNLQIVNFDAIKSSY
jgi:hypothetical protein